MRFALKPGPGRLFIRALGFALLLTFLVMPVAAGAELAAWDQERVTDLAKELKTKSDALYDTYYKLENATLGSPGAQPAEDLKDQLQRIKEQTHHFAAELGHGKGREKTENTFKHLNELVRDAEQSIQEMFTEDDLLAAAMDAGGVLRRLEPYYDPKANVDPTSGSPTP